MILSGNYRLWNYLFNSEKDRRIAATELVNHIRKNSTEEKITLVAHSHGGNVAIQAAALLWQKYQIKVDIININTPAYNDFRDPENPEDNFGINKLTHFYTEGDGVAGQLAPGSDDSYHICMTNVTNIKLSGKSNNAYNVLYNWVQNHFVENVNLNQMKSKKEDADREAAERSGGWR